MTDPPSARILAANTALLAEGALDAIPEHFAPDYVAHLTDGETLRGHAAIRKVVGAWRRAFPDLEVDVEILLEKDDRVAWQRTLRGTHKETLAGFPPTGRPVVWRDLAVSRLRNALIVEEWVVSELAERLLRARRG